MLLKDKSQEKSINKYEETAAAFVEMAHTITWCTVGTVDKKTDQDAESFTHSGIGMVKSLLVG